ncbi:NGCA protein, partial [Alcedo cyanopectus]|nr:NGCA protein [Ceyx cyanopectus]
RSSQGPLTPFTPAAATRLEVPPQNVTAKKGETVSFRCVASFDPQLSPRGLEWRRDGHPVGDSRDSDK